MHQHAKLEKPPKTNRKQQTILELIQINYKEILQGSLKGLLQRLALFFP